MTDMREAVARAIAKDDVRWLLMSSAEQLMVMFYVGQGIAAARPYIREECANVAELAWTASPAEIAAAIRSLNND